MFGAFLDTGGVPVNDPLAVLVAGGLNGLSPGIVADGTGEGAHAQLSAGGLLRDDAVVPSVLAGGGESAVERGAAVVHQADVIGVAGVAAVRVPMVADGPVVDAVLGYFFRAHVDLYAFGGVVGWMAVRVGTVVEEPRDDGVAAALYEPHEGRPAVFRELDDFVQLLAVVASDGLGGVGGVGGGCGDVQLGTGILDTGIADGDAAVADGRGVAGAVGGDVAAADSHIGVVAADARRTVAARLAAFGVDRAALDGHAAAAIKARADARSIAAARCFDGAAVDHDVHFAGAMARADAGAVRAAGYFVDGAVGDLDGDSALLVFGCAATVAAAADASAAVFAARGLGDGAAGDIDLGLAGDVGAGADACAAALANGIVNSAVGDVDLGFAVGFRARADASAADAGGLFDHAAGDVDGGAAVAAAAAADARAAVLARSHYYGCGVALDFDGGTAAADAVADVFTHGLHDGVVLDGDCGLACSVRAAADAGTIAAALGIYGGFTGDGDIGIACSP